MIRAYQNLDVQLDAQLELSTAETKPATGRRKARPVVGCQAAWRARSPDSWRVPCRFGPEGQIVVA